MSPRLRILTFVLGAALFALLIYHAGPAQLAANLRRAGWVLLPVVLLGIPVNACYATAWRLSMIGAERTPPLGRTAVISVGAFALNLVTPFVQAGGEVFRTGAVAPWLGIQRATGVTIAYYMLHTVSNLLIWLTGVVVVLLYLPLAPPLLAAFSVAAVLMVGLVLFIFWRHQQGVVAPIVGLLRRLPLLRRLVRPLEARREQIEQFDAVITGFYHQDRGRFFLALGVDFLGRVLACGEYWLAARGVGLVLGLPQTLIVGALAGLAVNVVFFVPLETGVKESGLYLTFTLLGLDPVLGVYSAIVQRLREFVWVGLGLVCVSLAGGRVRQPE